MTLRNKLKAMTAPCREVDAEIAEMFEPNKRWIYDPMDEHGARNLSPHYTASLDATVELVEREMPHSWDVMRLTTYGTYSARIQCDYTGEHTLPAVALLLALVDAKEIER